MQIECPSCGTAYEVPEHVLARKRMMRCARCARDWAPPPPPVPAAAPVLAAAPLAITPPPPPAVPRGRKVAVLAAWAASFAVLAAGVWLGIVSQPRVVKAWPASARLYAVLGR